MMRKMLLAGCFLLLAATLAAQAPEGVLKRAGGGLKLDGVRLSPEAMALVLSDIDGVDCRKEWDGYAKGRKTGIGMMIGGGVTAGAGAALALGTAVVEVVGLLFAAPLWSIAGDSGQESQAQYVAQFEPWYVASAVGVCAGAAVAVAGIPVLVVNDRRMNRIVDRYNAAPAELTVGLQPHGVGVSLRF